MNVQRIRWEIQQAIEHFPNIDTHATTDGGLFIKALMQTSVGQVYVIAVTFVGYAAEMPKVTVITPADIFATCIRAFGIRPSMI
jgi:hypothetical protein